MESNSERRDGTTQYRRALRRVQAVPSGQAEHLLVLRAERGERTRDEPVTEVVLIRVERTHESVEVGALAVGDSPGLPTPVVGDREAGHLIKPRKRGIRYRFESAPRNEKSLGSYLLTGVWTHPPPSEGNDLCVVLPEED